MILLLEGAFVLELALTVLCFSCEHLLHLLCKTHCFTLTAHLTSWASTFLGFFVEDATLCPAHTMLTVARDPAFITGAFSPLVLSELAASVTRADCSIFAPRMTGASTLAVCTNKAHIALADADRDFAGGLDEAFAISTTNLALEHGACDMACLASVWLLALTPCAIRHFFLILDTGATISTTTCQVRMRIHGTTVSACFTHVCLVTFACAYTLLLVNFAATVAITRLAGLGNAWA